MQNYSRRQIPGPVGRRTGLFQSTGITKARKSADNRRAGIFKFVLAATVLASPLHLDDGLAADFPKEDDTMFVNSDVLSSSGWSGFYAGAYTDYKWISADIDTGTNIDHANGIGGGGYIGFNRRLNDGFIVGVEGAAGVSAADGSAAGNSLKQDWETSIRARMGYAFEQNMIYGLAGLAASAFDLETATGSDTNTHFGWTIGAGVETQLTDNLVARAEYGYVDYSQQTYNAGAVSTKINPNSHSLKLGIGLKF